MSIFAALCTAGAGPGAFGTGRQFSLLLVIFILDRLFPIMNCLGREGTGYALADLQCCSSKEDLVVHDDEQQETLCPTVASHSSRTSQGGKCSLGWTAHLGLEMLGQKARMLLPH